MKFKKIVFIVVCFCFSYAANSQAVKDVIAKYVDFIGGDKQWSKVNSIITEGTYNYGGISFPFTAYSKAPNKYKFVVPLKGKYFTQAYDGQKGWKIDAFKGETKKTVLTGKPATALANEADVELESPFINYAAKGNTPSLEGTDTVEGKACNRIKLLRQNSDTETYFFTKDSGELIEKKAVAKNAELDNSVLDIYYTDYRSVNGIKLPFTTICKANGQTILTIKLTKAQTNIQISDNEFEP